MIARMGIFSGQKGESATSFACRRFGQNLAPIIEGAGACERGGCAGRIAQGCSREGSDRRPAARTHSGEPGMECSTSRDGIHRSSQPSDRDVPSRFREHEKATGFRRNAKIRDLTREDVVIAAAALSHGRASEFPTPNDECSICLGTSDWKSPHSPRYPPSISTPFIVGMRFAAQALQRDCPYDPMCDLPMRSEPRKSNLCARVEPWSLR